MPWTRGCVVVLGMSLVVLACGSTSSSDAGSASGFVSSYCQAFTPCCQKAGKPTDGASCRAFIGAFTASETYDPVAGQQCLDAVHAASSQPDFCTNSSSSLDSSACANVFKSTSGGTKAPGDTCSQDSECAPSTEGKVTCATHFETGGGQTRKCQLSIVGKEGDAPCIGTKNGNVTSYSSSSNATPPDRGYVCDVANGIACDSTTNECTHIGAVGEDCSTNALYGCVATAYCDSASKKCVARLPEGADCSSFLPCTTDTYCDSTSKTCTAAIADGASCTTSSQCKSESCVNKICSSSGSSDLGLALLCGS